MKKELIEHLERETGLQREQICAVLTALADLTTAAPEQDLQDATDIDEVARFWQCFCDAVAAGRLVREEDYRSDGVRLGLIWRQVHGAYLVHYQHRYGRHGMSAVPLLAMLKKQPYYVTMMESMRVGDKRTSVQLFDQPGLPVRIPASVVRNEEA